MAINAKRIQEIIDKHAGQTEPHRSIFIVHDIEYLLRNPKTKFGIHTSCTVASFSLLAKAQLPDSSEEDRAVAIAKFPGSPLNADLDPLELAREVRRHIKIAKDHGWK